MSGKKHERAVGGPLCNPGQDTVVAGVDGMAARTLVDSPEQALEMMLMGLRLAEGVSLARHARLAGRPLPADALEELSTLGLVAVDGDRLRATATGRPVLNAILERLLAG